MFEPNFSIDISLLAIILGMYVTNKDRNLILLLVCLLFMHVLMTNEYVDTSEDVSVEDYVDATAEEVCDAPVGATAPVPVAVEADHPKDAFSTTVSASVFQRRLSTPQTKLTSTVFPATSTEANGKLASARDSFFKSVVSGQKIST